MRRVVAKRLFKEATDVCLAAGIKTDFWGHRRRLYRVMKEDYKRRRGGYVGRS